MVNCVDLSRDRNSNKLQEDVKELLDEINDNLNTGLKKIINNIYIWTIQLIQ